jgi:hypothetical protein
MYPVPTVQQLTDFSGRPPDTYSSYALNALIQATIMFTALTQLTSPEALAPDDQQLALYGICAMGDYLYLRQPYQQVIASPLQNESIGSYSYGKAMAEMARNAQAAEVNSEALGVQMFDLAVRMLSLRTRAGGVYTGGITVFEQPKFRYELCELKWNDEQGRFELLGPEHFDQVDFGAIDVNAEMFPQDPGVG